MTSRAWCFTDFDVSDERMQFWKDLEFKLLVVGRETAPDTGRKHLQGFIIWTRSTRITALKKLAPQVHWEKAKCKDAGNYCMKEGDYVKIDNRKQGQRTDLAKLAARVRAGETVDDLLDGEADHGVHVYGRVLTMIEDKRMKRETRDAPPQAIWIFGKTGVGKSRLACARKKPTFVWSPDGRWWDEYRQEPVCVMDDFRGEIPLASILRMADRYKFCLPRRCKAPIPFVSEEFIITSCQPPEKIFAHTGEDMAQVYRRFKVYRMVEGRKCTRWTLEDSEMGDVYRAYGLVDDV